MKERNCVMWLTSGTRGKDRSKEKMGVLNSKKRGSKADEKFGDET